MPALKRSQRVPHEIMEPDARALMNTAEQQVYEPEHAKDMTEPTGL